MRLPNYRDMYYNLSVNIFAVSYRGYGLCEGTPTEEGLKKDAEAILNWVLTNGQVDNTKLILFGRSLGGAVGE